MLWSLPLREICILLDSLLTRVMAGRAAQGLSNLWWQTPDLFSIQHSYKQTLFCQNIKSHFNGTLNWMGAWEISLASPSLPQTKQKLPAHVNCTCMSSECSARALRCASSDATCCWYCRRCFSQSSDFWRNSCKDSRGGLEQYIPLQFTSTYAFSPHRILTPFPQQGNH